MSRVLSTDHRNKASGQQNIAFEIIANPIQLRFAHDICPQKIRIYEVSLSNGDIDFPVYLDKLDQQVLMPYCQT